MITINGQKMGKSLGNFITLDEFFTGNHASLEKAYSPMCIRFFILQAHYRSTLDFSNEALQAAEKGLKRLMQAVETLKNLETAAVSTSDIPKLTANCYEAMNDDFNSPIVIANLFEGLRIINAVNDGKETITASDLESLKNLYTTFIFDILGLKNETENNQFEVVDGLMQMILSFRQQAKANKDYAASDNIRDELAKLGIAVKDGKDGSSWTLE
jgi:cysteinyl-tRNA synthetase